MAARTKPGALSARDESGKPVDWWFIYKVSSESESSTGEPATGLEYVYFDSTGAKKNKGLALSPNRLDKKRGALYDTLNQLYSRTAKSSKRPGWFFYNDQYPPGKVVSSRGHTKGALAFDLQSNSAFWLVQSTPNFPPSTHYGFPKTGHMMAQTYLCVTLKDADTAKNIAKQMYVAQQPNVYAKAIPAELRNRVDDPRVLLCRDKVATGTTPVHSDIPFLSKAGTRFRAIAKNKHWGLDFYNDLVGPALHVDLDVETWQHDPTPGTRDSDKIHKIVVMHSVNLEPLGAPFSWSEVFDHAKLAISDEGQRKAWVCVGDINFTKAQEKRGGGTVCFQNKALWKGLSEILSAKQEPPRKKARRGGGGRSRTARKGR